MPKSQLMFNNILHVPNITLNLISVSKLERDNKVYFEFHANKCFVKLEASNMVLLDDFLIKVDCTASIISLLIPHIILIQIIFKFYIPLLRIQLAVVGRIIHPILPTIMYFGIID